jgi:hypothetical protein
MNMSDWDNWDINNFNFRDSNMDGQWNREFEVHLTTYDGAQHLRLNGWFKREKIIVKSESIENKKDIFGSFMIIVDNIMLEKLKEANLKQGLFCDIEVFNSEYDPKYYHYKKIKNEGLVEKIQDFLFNFQISDKEDIDKFLIQANEASLALFKKNKDFVKDYVKTKELSKKEKIRDIDLMIESFQEVERYEDCAFLVKVKNKVIKHYKKINNE